MAATAGSALLATDAAGADPINTNENMPTACSGDFCSAWVLSSTSHCVQYNIQWTHIWENPGSTDTAIWHVLVQQWWNDQPGCAYGGSAHVIGNVADLYPRDVLIPHNYTSPTNGMGQVRFFGGLFTDCSNCYTRGTQNVIQWTACVTGQTQPVFRNSESVYQQGISTIFSSTSSWNWVTFSGNNGTHYCGANSGAFNPYWVRAVPVQAYLNDPLCQCGPTNIRDAIGLELR
jgi:hypothetical protein